MICTVFRIIGLPCSFTLALDPSSPSSLLHTHSKPSYRLALFAGPDCGLQYRCTLTCRWLQNVTLCRLATIIAPFFVFVVIFPRCFEPKMHKREQYLPCQIGPVVRPDGNPCAGVEVKGCSAVEIGQALDVLVMRMPHHGIHAAKGGEFQLLHGRIYAPRHFIFSHFRRTPFLAPQPPHKLPESRRQVRRKDSQCAQRHRTHWMPGNKEIAQPGNSKDAGYCQNRKKRNSQRTDVYRIPEEIAHMGGLE